MVGKRVALSRRAVAVERDGTLPVEMRGCFVPIQVGEDRCKRFASLQYVGRLTFLARHIDREARVDGEERLSFSVAAVGAMGVCIEQLANRDTVGGFRRRERSVNSQVHGHSLSSRSVSTISTTRAAVSSRAQSRCSSAPNETQLMGLPPAWTTRSRPARCASSEVPPIASTTGYTS